MSELARFGRINQGFLIIVYKKPEQLLIQAANRSPISDKMEIRPQIRLDGSKSVSWLWICQNWLLCTSKVLALNNRDFHSKVVLIKRTLNSQTDRPDIPQKKSSPPKKRLARRLLKTVFKFERDTVTKTVRYPYLRNR